MRPLDGVRVLDLSRLLPGPFATLVLSDLGAVVDKIEDPVQGDYLRHMPPKAGADNVAYGLLNRGKRSAVLDLKRVEGQRALRAMLASYDVLFEQFRPGVLTRLGLSPDQLRAEFPRLIICSLTGYGQTGPLAQRAGHDLNYLARAGVLGSQGPVGGAPQVPGFQLADVSGGMWSVIAILSALLERQRTTAGAWLDIAMSEGTVPFAPTSIGAALAGVAGVRGDEPLTGGIAPYSVYATKDGAHVTLAALEPKFWMTFAASIGLSPSLADLAPGPHQATLRTAVATAIAARTQAEWAEYAATHDVPIEPVLAPAQAIEDEHLRSRGVFFELATAAGNIPQVRTPVTPRTGVFTPPPSQGEHTRAIFRDAGLDDAIIAELVEKGVAR
ncbi:MAG: CaiB/BaiF CoA-transferase family protein [Polyangiaceae bacterium]